MWHFSKTGLQRFANYTFLVVVFIYTVNLCQLLHMHYYSFKIYSIVALYYTYLYIFTNIFVYSYLYILSYSSNVLLMYSCRHIFFLYSNPVILLLLSLLSISFLFYHL